MKKILLFIPLIVLAEEGSKHTFLSDLLGNLIPIVVFFGIFIFLARKMNKKYSTQAAIDSNNKLTEANKELTSELKRVADALEKKEKD